MASADEAMEETRNFRRRHGVKRGDAFTWGEGNELVAEVGNEEHLAARMTAERLARGWSQERLAKELRAIGCHLPQSSISKIETPPPGGRRDITVAEALALARLFEIPLGELLLPPSALRDLAVTRAYADGLSRLFRVGVAQADYDHCVDTVASACRTSDEWRVSVERDLQAAENRWAEERERSLNEDPPRPNVASDPPITVRYFRDILEVAAQVPELPRRRRINEAKK